MNKQSEEVADILCMGLPGATEETAQIAVLVYVKAIEYVHKQYEDRPESRRPTVRFNRIESVITNDMAEAEAFRPGHDCDRCREGVEHTKQWLKEHPDYLIALVNIHYTEVFR